MFAEQKCTEVGGKIKMSEFIPKAPDYAGDGIAIWKDTDKNGKAYLKVTVLRGKAIPCFKVEPKEIKEEEI